MSAYQVLARKWRPKTFADLVGQQHVVKALKNALSKGRLHHAYLLTGTRGVGKTTIARILAKSLNCEHANEGEPCGQCQSCREIDSGRFVDLLEIDAASNTGIDNIREVLENAQYAPTAGRYKVYIIDEVHMLSKSAFNAMLKTLEEPPEHVKFILATTDPHKVPITVLSRCLQFVLRNMTAQQIADHLAHVLNSEAIQYEPNALALIARAANGSMRDALSLLDQAISMVSGSIKENDVRQMIGAVDKRYLFDLLNQLSQHNHEQLIHSAQEMLDNAIGFDNALNELALLLQRLALIKTLPNTLHPNDPEAESLAQLATQFSDEQIQLYYQCVIHGKKDLPFAPDEYAGFIMTLLRMMAFAPFTTQVLPQNAQISNTQLHNPEPDADYVKKKSIHSLTQPENESPTHQPLNHNNHDDDTPPWEESPNNTTNEEIQTPSPIQENTVSGSLISGSLNTRPTESDSVLPLNKENWLHIVQNIAPQAGTAQMLLRHLAWQDFDNNTLTLKVEEKYDNTNLNHPTHIQRITDLLNQTYQQNLSIRIQQANELTPEETVHRHQEKQEEEHRQRAQQLLEQDAAARDIITLFDAKWQEDTLSLKHT